jgi:tetratricopeptide (TPR) repeat protein
MSLGDLERRLGNVDAARRHYDAALQLYRLEQDPVGQMNVHIGLARLEAVLSNIEAADAHYQRVFTQVEAIGFGNHPTTLDLRREYEDFQRMVSTRDDSLAGALSALLRADSDRALAQVLTDHPMLAEADALFALAGLLNQALAAQQSEAVTRLVVYLVTLLDAYNRAHGEQVDAERHQAVIGLCEQVIPLAEQIHADLATQVRGQVGWACNTLGNHFAGDGENQDLEQAVAAYTRGLAFDPGNAMLLRNRAGVHLDRRDPAAAQADVAAAAALEPDATRLAGLRAQLAQLRQPSSGDAP